MFYILVLRSEVQITWGIPFRTMWFYQSRCLKLLLRVLWKWERVFVCIGGTYMYIWEETDNKGYLARLIFTSELYLFLSCGYDRTTQRLTDVKCLIAQSTSTATQWIFNFTRLGLQREHSCLMLSITSFCKLWKKTIKWKNWSISQQWRRSCFGISNCRILLSACLRKRNGPANEPRFSTEWPERVDSRTMTYLDFNCLSETNGKTGSSILQPNYVPTLAIWRGCILAMSYLSTVIPPTQ